MSSADRHAGGVSSTRATRRKRRFLRGALLATCVAGAFFAVTALVIAVQDKGPHDLAVQLREHRATAPVEQVQLFHNNKARGRVEVTFDADGRSIVAKAAGADPSTVSSDPADLTVAYLPGAPYRAMLTEDIDYFADDALSEAGTVAGIGLVAAALAGGALIALGQQAQANRDRRAARRA